MTVPAIQNSSSYYSNFGAHPPQSDLLTDRAIVTEAYTVIPKGVPRDIVTSVFPEWTNTRAWVLNRPVAGAATTFSQAIVEVAPGGGATKPEPQAQVQGFIFVLTGQLTLLIEGTEHVLVDGGFAYLPAGATWSARNDGTELTSFHWSASATKRSKEWPHRLPWWATSAISNLARCRAPMASGAPPACSIPTTSPSTSA